MKITFKSNTPEGETLLVAQAAHAIVKAQSKIVAQAAAIVEREKEKLPLGGGEIFVGATQVASVGKGREMTRLDKGALSLFLSKHGKALSDFESRELSSPSWAWVAD